MKRRADGEAAKLQVVGIGSMAVDRVHLAHRILAGDEKGMLRDVEGGGPVSHRVGGVVLNHLGWAAALGLRTGIVGRQADDEYGRFLRAAMARLGIACHLVIEGEASTVAEIFVDDFGGRAIYMAPGTTSGTTPAHVREHHAERIRGAERLSTEVSQLPLDATLEALRIAREAGVYTLVDLDVPPSDAVATLGDSETLDEILSAADLLKPSKSAAAELVPDAGNDPAVIARRLRECYGNRAVVVTDGEAGCAISADDFEGCVPVERVKAIDTTGCGDAFFGGLLVALHHGLDWEATGRLANACGAACALQLGAFPEEPELARERVLERYEGPAPALAPLRVDASQESVSAAQRVLEVAVEEIDALAQRFDAAALARAVELIAASHEAGGRVHVTGVGKPEHVARYAASLLSSTGTPATFLHATEVLHGSLGQLVPGDVVIAISNSGDTAEMREAVSAMASAGVRIIAVTGARDSWLARNSDVVLDAGVAREGGPLELAPRVSVAAEVLVLAALGAELQARNEFSPSDYADRHPAGHLGRRAADLGTPESD